MKLLQPLTLEDVQTGEVSLVPTKKFFKPVVVLSAPLTKENADMLQVGYLFDANGNPHPFEGAHRLTGELSGASLLFKSKQSGEIEILTEKVTSMGCALEEKTGMRLKFHAHLPESKEEFLECLEFLSKLNKEKFEVVIKDEQRSLFEGEKRSFEAKTVPFIIKSGTKPMIKGQIQTQAFETGGFIGAWEALADGFASAASGGVALSADNPNKPTEREAWIWAMKELLRFTKDMETAGIKEIKAQSLLVDWIMIQCPELQKLKDGGRKLQPITNENIETQEEPVH